MENTMEKIEATKLDGKVIELTDAKNIQKLLDLVEKDENFTLYWEEQGEKKAQLMIANNLISSIKSGEIVVRSSENSKVPPNFGGG